MRIKDNKELRDSIIKPETGTLEELNSFYLAMIATYICDISKSLAILADSSEVGKELIKQDCKKEKETE